MEVVVAVGVFGIIMSMVMGMYSSVIEGQRHAVSAQMGQESMRYAMELMSKELRQAVRSDGECAQSGMPFEFAPSVFVNRNFNASSTDEKIYFRNKHKICVSYYLKNNVLMRRASTTEMAITPDDVKISGLKFLIRDNIINVNPGDRIQPHVTVAMKVETVSSREQYRQPFYIQTTISSRFYQ